MTRDPNPLDDLPCIHCGQRIGPEYGRLSDETGTHPVCHPRHPSEDRPDCYRLVFSGVERLGARRRREASGTLVLGEASGAVAVWRRRPSSCCHSCGRCPWWLTRTS